MIEELQLPLGEVPRVPNGLSPELYAQLMEYHVALRLIVLKINELKEKVNEHDSNLP